MRRFFFVFLITLVIGFLSLLLAIVAGGLLFYGERAPFSSPERVPYIVPNLVQGAIMLLPGIWFIRGQARRGQGLAVWAIGVATLVVAEFLFWGFISFGRIW